jgi:acyl-coenzyme A synthetase/AMP-(fatty) acid ligase
LCDRSLFTYIAHVYAFLSKKIWIPISANLKENEIVEILAQLENPIILSNGPVNIESIKKHYDCKDLNDLDFDKYKPKPLNIHTSTNLVTAIFFTSGSTGKPKGVKLSLANIIINLINIEKIIKAKQRDIFVDFHEISFVISIPILIYCLYSGSSLVVGKNTDLLNLKRLYKKYKFTILITVPTLLKVIDSSIYTPRMELKTLVTCGEPITKQLIINLIKKHNLKSFFNFYGSTEVSPWILYADLKECLEKNIFLDNYAPAGKKLNFIDLNIEKKSNTLVATGPQVSSGYLNLKSSKFKRIGNYFSYNSGDIFEKISKYYFCKGRIDHEFKRNGERMSILNLEYMYKKILKIENLYVVFLKQKNKLFMVTKKKISKDTQSKFFKKLSRNKKPDQIITLNSVDKTSTGKISRKKLEEICEGHLL